MKEIRLVFDDYDYRRLRKHKEELLLTWDEFVLLLPNIPVSKLKKVKGGNIKWMKEQQINK